jgi:predicted dehydrogenase
MSEQLRLGLVGCGGISRALYVNLLSGLADRACVVAACDVFAERARERSQQFQEAYQQVAEQSRERIDRAATSVEREHLGALATGAELAGRSAPRVFDDLDRFVCDDDLDVVVVTTQPLMHPVASIAALQAGRHVFTEGPMAANLREVDAMIEAADQYGRKLSIQYCTRFFREAEQAKLAIASGKLGRILLGRMDASWYHTMDSYFNKDAWRGTWAGEGGGSAFHHGRYCSDLFLHLMDDELTEVAAFTGRLAHPVEVEDVSTASLRFRSGALGHATTTTCAHENEAVDYDRVEIFGEKASLKVSRTPDYSGTTPLLRHGTKYVLSIGSSDESYARDLRAFLDEAIPPRAEDMQVTQLKRFFDAVESDGPVPVSGASARKHVELVRATYKSAMTKSIATLPLAIDDPYYGPEGTQR